MLAIYKKQRNNTKILRNRRCATYLSKRAWCSLFSHDMVYGDFKDLNRRIASDKILRDKACDIAKNFENDGFQRNLTSWLHGFVWFLSFLIKKASGSVVENETMSNKELAEELQKSVIGKFKIRKVYSFFIDNISGADLADMELISRFSKGIRFLLCAIDTFSKYELLIRLKDKKRNYNY